MIHIGGDVDAGTCANRDRRLIIDHLLALARQHVDNLFSARGLCRSWPFPGAQHHTEAKALSTSDRWLAEKPRLIKRHRLDIIAIHHPAAA